MVHIPVDHTLRAVPQFLLKRRDALPKAGYVLGVLVNVLGEKLPPKPQMITITRHSAAGVRPAVSAAGAVVARIGLSRDPAQLSYVSP